MPAVYQDIGLKFLYPENWSIIEEETYEWPRSVTIQSPGGAFWAVHVYPPLSDEEALMQEVIASIRSEFNEMEILEAEETISDCPTHGYDMAFFYLDLLVEAHVRSLQTPSATLIWLVQAENKDYEENELVFQAMTKSMLDNVVASRGRNPS